MHRKHFEEGENYKGAMRDRSIRWRCFHCDATFTKEQRRWAQQHFGTDCDATPVCQMRVPGEHHLLMRLRKLEAEVAEYRAEDTDLHRAIHSMQSDHHQALLREEEKGYEKGLRDGMAVRDGAASVGWADQPMNPDTPSL